MGSVTLKHVIQRMMCDKDPTTHSRCDKCDKHDDVCYCPVYGYELEWSRVAKWKFVTENAANAILDKYTEGRSCEQAENKT